MGVIIRKCYSVQCDYCKCLLEDYTGELVGITECKKMAVALAREKGWVRNGKLWACPICAKEDKKSQVKSYEERCDDCYINEQEKTTAIEILRNIKETEDMKNE